MSKSSSLLLGLGMVSALTIVSQCGAQQSDSTTTRAEEARPSPRIAALRPHVSMIASSIAGVIAVGAVLVAIRATRRSRRLRDELSQLKRERSENVDQLDAAKSVNSTLRARVQQGEQRLAEVQSKLDRAEQSLAAAPAGGTSPTVPSTPTPADNPPEASLDNKAWLSLVEECVELFDELQRHRDQMDGGASQIATHAQARITELLERSGVEVIDSGGEFDRTRHRAADAGPVTSQGMAVCRVIVPGFAVERRVLRRADVETTRP